ncbi:MAG: 2-oxo acid dehydrogenase subunit E2, partial [Promethearchaeota archaeon]
SKGTFTVTNLGMFGVDIFTPILNPPESGILGVGRIVKKWVVKKEEEQPKIASTMHLSLTWDHRVIDGHIAAQFLSRIKEIIENYHLLFQFKWR